VLVFVVCCFHLFIGTLSYLSFLEVCHAHRKKKHTLKAKILPISWLQYSISVLFWVGWEGGPKKTNTFFERPPPWHIILTYPVVSDIPSGSVYIAYIYIYMFYLFFCLAYTLTFFLAYTLIFFLAYAVTKILTFYLAFSLTYILTSCLTFFLASLQPTQYYFKIL